MGRVFGFLSIVIVLGIGMYIYSKQVQSSSALPGEQSESCHQHHGRKERSD